MVYLIYQSKYYQLINSTNFTKNEGSKQVEISL